MRKLNKTSAALVSACAFAVTSPYVLLHYEGFLANMSRLSAFLYERQAGLALWDHLQTTLPAGLGWPLVLASIAALVRALWLRRPADLVGSLAGGRCRAGRVRARPADDARATSQSRET